VENAEASRRRKDGSLLDVALTISPLRDATGAVFGASSLERDVTEERSIAARLAASAAALEAAYDEARQSELTTRRFLDDAAHQLRTPITSIRASAETLQRKITHEQREKLLAAVVRESERAGRLMAGLLRMARLGHPSPVQLVPTDLGALCEEEADQARLDSPHLDISVRIPESPPLGRPELAADVVSEILVNLIDNARRHARTTIEIAVRRDDDRLRICVMDDGPGLPADQAELVFERFVSLDAKGGSGLGLAIARELARAHGGDVTYEDGAFVLGLPWRPGMVTTAGRS
jgi:two-component system OmpR family sensor kinase